jgi:hypothetical protein
MKHTGLFKTLCFCAGCLLLSACVDYSDIQPFDGKTLPRKSGYTTGVTNDWIYFNLRTGEVFNVLGVNRDIKEGGQMNRTDWDLAFICIRRKMTRKFTQRKRIPSCHMT